MSQHRHARQISHRSVSLPHDHHPSIIPPPPPVAFSPHFTVHHFDIPATFILHLSPHPPNLHPTLLLLSPPAGAPILTLYRCMIDKPLTPLVHTRLRLIADALQIIRKFRDHNVGVSRLGRCIVLSTPRGKVSKRRKKKHELVLNVPVVGTIQSQVTESHEDGG